MGVGALPVGSIARAARVLEALSVSPDGCALAELVTKTQFTKTTTFRVLAALQDVNYVVQDPEDRSYRLGTKLAALARRADHFDLASLARRPMRRLALLSEDTVFLSVPEGAAAVCVARQVGPFPIRTLTLDRGDRRPLGVGAGALAIYSSMSDARRTAVNRANANWLADYGTSPEQLEKQRRTIVDCGYALNAGGVVPGMSAIALPLLTRQGHLIGGLAIGAINDRMTAERIETFLLPALRKEADLLSERLGDLKAENLG